MADDSLAAALAGAREAIEAADSEFMDDRLDWARASFAAGAVTGAARRLLAAAEAVLAVAGDCRETSWDFGGDGDMRPVAWALDPQKVREAITQALTGEEAPGDPPD